MLSYLRVPLDWGEVFRRTGRAILQDDISGWAAELAYYFFLALFPALLFVVSLASFFPLHDLVNRIVTKFAGVVPPDLLALLVGQLRQISMSHKGGLLTIGIIGAIWSASSGMSAVIDTLNQAYDIREGRPWWKVKLIALALTIAVALFMIVSFGLVLLGPAVGGVIAGWWHMGGAFAATGRIAEWLIVFALVVTGIGIVYYYAPDAEQDWVWITPGSLLATALWLVGSIGLRYYVTQLTSYNAAYGTIGGVIVVLLWFYITGLAILLGAELNAEIEHASPYGKDPGEKQIGVRRKIGLAAYRAYRKKSKGRASAPSSAALAQAVSGRPPGGHGQASEGAVASPALVQANCDVDLPQPAPAPLVSRPRPASRILIGGLIVGQFALVVWSRLRRTRIAQ